MACVSTFFELSSLLDGLHDSIYLQDLILEPHLYVNERVGHRSRQIIIILLQLVILSILEEELLFRQLALLW